jgi:tRNA nucleotidyltransferase (CCA-adding enzyme)
METRLSPDQLRAVNFVEEIARAHGMNVYLTGGTIRDLMTGFSIRDLDFTVQGNPLKFQRELEKFGARIEATDESIKWISLTFPGGFRAEIEMAHTARYEKPGKPPVVEPSGIAEDLRCRDFTVNAMALSLNPGSRGLLLDPMNGAADLETKVIRVLHNYAFLEQPILLIRATRFLARFHWTFEERTQARYQSAREGNYIENVNTKDIGYEIEQIAYEDDPLGVMKSLEEQDWLKVLHPHWATAKVDQAGLAALLKTRQQLLEIGVDGNPSAAVMYFLTDKLPEKETAEIQKAIPNKTLVESWKRLEEDAKELAKKLTGKESATPSMTWDVLTASKPETLMFLAATTKQQVVQKHIENYFGKWRQIPQRFPLPEMIELQITPSQPNYKEVTDKVFRLLLDGKLRTPSETAKFLKPFAPPPPPPPPPPKEKRGKAKAAEAAAAAEAAKKAEAEKKAAAEAAKKTEKPAKAAKKAAAKEAPKKATAPAKKAVLKAKAPAKKVAVKASAKKAGKKK